LGVAIIATVRYGGQALGARVAANDSEPASIGRPTALIAGTVTVLLVFSAVAGLLRANHLDDNGVPLQPTAEWIASRPEATMLYPETTLDDALTYAQENRLWPSAPAGGGVTGFTPDTGIAIQTWYAQRLTARGWKLAKTNPGRQLSWQFNRGDREVFTLIYDGPDVRYPATSHIASPQRPGDGTITTRYDVYPAGQPHS
ncbi:MAG: hypothetical protein M3256_16295, partial [Actinomycetota bacterium]|nr:hypothetical protein [Actinomycetota bacterium]